MLRRAVGLRSIVLAGALALGVLHASVVDADGGGPPPPASLQFLQAIKAMLDDNALSRPGTLTLLDLKRRFGPRVSVEVVTDLDRAAYVRTADRAVDLYLTHLDEHDPTLTSPVCRARMSVPERGPALAFEHVVALLGPDWTRDPKSEQANFLAISREPFNPPVPEATVPMGNAIIAYRIPHGTLQLKFGPAGELVSVASRQAPC